MSRVTVNKDCLRGGCEKWHYEQAGSLPVCLPECWRCGFNILEAARRREIPLTLCKDGLRRKLIPPKPKYTDETSEETSEEPED